MSKHNATKKALMLSLLSMVLCVSMLVGSTFAWFTDTATTAVTKIEAGTLDVDIVGSDGNSLDGETLSFRDVNGNANVLWEPGATFNLDSFKIVNKGNLALKYKVVISGLSGSAKLLEAIDFTINGEAVADWEGILLPAGKEPLVDNEVVGETDFFTISGTMRKDAGNEYRGLSIDGIGITVYATQYTYESDSENNQYDKDATYPVVVSHDELNSTLTLDDLKDENGNISPVEVTLGKTEAKDIDYNQVSSGYTGKGVMLGSTNLNQYGVQVPAAGEYKFTFKDGTIDSAATGYDGEPAGHDNRVYMLVPGNSDVVFENMIFNGVVNFEVQKYTSPWSNLNSITFKNCTFNGIIVGTCPASNVTFDGCTFNSYTNTESANNSNPIWWREDTEGSGANANPIKTFTFVNNTVTSTRPVKIERIGYTVSPVFTIKNNTFDISAQADDTVTKNMAINIGMGENPNLPFTLIDDGNTISANTASLYTAALNSGSNQYKAVSGMKVLDGNGNAKTITAMVWKTTTGETFELKSID